MNSLKAIVILALAATLAACNTTPASGAMTREDAVNLKAIAPLAMNGLANSIRQGGSSVVASGLQTGRILAARFGSSAPLGAGIAPQASSGNCGPSTAPTDADGDKVPASFSYTYNCTVVFSPSFIVKWSATATIGAGGAYSVATDQRVIFQPDTTKNEFSYALTASYAPDADGNAQRFDAGTISFDGTVAYTDANRKLSRFRLVSSDLHFGGACPKGVDRGAVVSEDQSNIGGSKNNRFELKATACDTWTATYNGETLF